MIVTPVEYREPFWFKRDDLFGIAGARGGKARTAWALAQGATALVTAGARQSPQVLIVASIAKALGIPCRCHVPAGALTPELERAQQLGATLVQHKAGYNSVIVARAREDAAGTGATLVPFGMECEEAVRQTARQVVNLPPECKRLVVPVGSAMSLAGVLTGLQKHEALAQLPVLGVVVGADPAKRLSRFCPLWWLQATLVKATEAYHDAATTCELAGVQLDPIYEAKCIPFMRPGDLLWCVGHREALHAG